MKINNPMMRRSELKPNQDVWIRRLGEKTPGSFRGIIRGVYGEIGIIVEMLDPIEKDYPWSCSVFPQGCIDLRD